MKCFRLLSTGWVLAATCVGFTGRSHAVVLSLDANLWLRADQGATLDSGASVSLWRDQSGKGNHATQSDPTWQPILDHDVFNGMPALQFTHSPSRRMVIPNSPTLNFPNNEFTQYFVLSTTTPTTTQRFYSKQDDSQTSTKPGYQNTIYAATRNRLGATIGDGSANSVLRITEANAGLTTGTPFMLRHLVDGDDQSYAKDGMNLGAQGLGSIGSSVGSRDVWIGRSPTQGQGLTGHFAEIVVFGRELNSAELILMDNYLSSKYNLGTEIDGQDRFLDAEINRYSGNRTAQGNYDLDVFGIGATSDASVSATSSAGLGISADAALQPDQWLLAGHKTAENSYVWDSQLPRPLARMWERDWYVDFTGTEELPITLTFDFEEGGLATIPFEPDEVALLFRLEETDPWQMLGLPAVVDGQTISFAAPGGAATAGLGNGYIALGMIPEPGSVVLLLCGILPLLLWRRRR